MSLPENPEMTAAFEEIFTRRGPDGELVYSEQDVEVLRPIFLFQIVRTLGLDKMPDEVIDKVGKYLAAIGIREGMSEDEQFDKMNAYFTQLQQEGFNEKLLEEVQQVFVKFGMREMGEDQKKKGEVYQEFSDRREAPKAPRAETTSPRKPVVGGPGPRRGLG